MPVLEKKEQALKKMGERGRRTGHTGRLSHAKFGRRASLQTDGGLRSFLLRLLQMFQNFTYGTKPDAPQNCDEKKLGSSRFFIEPNPSLALPINLLVPDLPNLVPKC